MKDCNVIQPELSAYVDGELAPRQREVVEAHLASCQRCQQVLAELKTLAAGTAALPRRQPAPQFLAQVRGKISRGDNPEALTWFDHLFRPFLLKIPVEVAALIAIALLVIHFELPRPVETVSGNQVALEGRVPAPIPISGPPHGAFVLPEQVGQQENLGIQRSRSMEAKAEPTRSALAESTAVLQSLQPGRAPEYEAVAVAASELTPPTEAPATTVIAAGPAENVPSVSVSAYDLSGGVPATPAAAVGGRNIKFTSGLKRKILAANAGTNGPALAPSSLTDEALTLARDAGIDPSRVGGVVVVQSRNLHHAQGRAEELATRYNGKIISILPPMESAGQVLFVEMPRENAAAFKLGLQQEAGSDKLFTYAMVADVAAFTTNIAFWSTTSTAPVGAVLTSGVDLKTGSTGAKSAADANAIFNGPPRLSLTDNPQAQAAATTVLEIFVVPPPSLAPTNPTPAAPPSIP